MPEMKTVLVADDDQALRRMLALVLTRAGYQVSQAVNGTEAVDAFTAAAPDLLILDIRMPGLNGLEALRQIRRLPGGAEVPAIMLTGLAEAEDRDAAAQAGANGFVVKSRFDVRGFVGQVEAALEVPSSARKPA